MTSDCHSQFFQVLEFLFRAQSSIADQFFAGRMSAHIKALLMVHIEYRSAVRDQKAIGFDYIRTCKECSALLEEMAYINSGDAVVIKMAQERILFYLQQLIADIKKVPAEPSVRPAALVQQSARTVASAPKVTRPKSSQRNQTQEKILEFVKRVPECRPKDIIGEFSALSQRTVKRSLKELSEMGLIVKKTTEDKAVYYSATSL